MADITRTLKLNAPPATVYTWLTDPTYIAQWFSDTASKTDVGYRFDWNQQDGGTVGFDATVIEDDAPHRFVYLTDDNYQTRFDVAHDGEKTVVVLTESGFTDDEAGQTSYEEHSGGWDWFLSRLQGLDEAT